MTPSVFRGVLGLALGCSLSALTFAEEVGPPEPEPLSEAMEEALKGCPNDTTDYVEARRRANRFEVTSGLEPEGFQPHFRINSLRSAKYHCDRRAWSAAGFDYLFIVSPEAQTSFLSDKTHANSEQDLIWRWRFREHANSESNVLFWGLNILRFGSTKPSEMSADNGLSVETIGGAEDEVFWMLGNFHYEYARKDNGFAMRAGHLFTNLKWATNKYLVDDRETFINGAFNSPAGVQWTSQKSLGFLFEYQGENAYAMGGFQDKKSDPRYPDFDSFVDGKFHYLGEVGYHHKRSRSSAGKYSATLNYTEPKDSSEEEGYGLVLNAFQDLNDTWGVYARYGRSWGQLTDFKYSVVAGFAHNAPLGWRSDQISIGLVEAKPAQGDAVDRGVNGYWKWQLTDTTDLTFDVQYYWDRSKAEPDDDDNALLVALRARFVF